MIINDKWFDSVKPKETRAFISVRDDGRVETKVVDVYELLVDSETKECWLGEESGE